MSGNVTILAQAGTVETEELLVAELEILGIRYLSRQSQTRSDKVRPAAQLIADMVRQPSSRVRMALISLLLAHPEFGENTPDALTRLTNVEGMKLKLIYSAAVLLQRIYAGQLQAYLMGNWRWLSDWFSVELKVSGNTPEERLMNLALIHRHTTGIALNWRGTYENAAQQLLHQWEMEQIWSQ
jgi:hypothetical protein